MGQPVAGKSLAMVPLWEQQQGPEVSRVQRAGPQPRLRRRIGIPMRPSYRPGSKGNAWSVSRPACSCHRRAWTEPQEDELRLPLTNSSPRAPTAAAAQPREQRSGNAMSGGSRLEDRPLLPGPPPRPEVLSLPSQFRSRTDESSKDQRRTAKVSTGLKNALTGCGYRRGYRAVGGHNFPSTSCTYNSRSSPLLGTIPCQGVLSRNPGLKSLWMVCSIETNGLGCFAASRRQIYRHQPPRPAQ